MKESLQAITWRWAKRHQNDVLIFLILLIIAGVPRLLDLGIFLTADEKNWIGRSYEFIKAFKDFRFNDMLQTTHPGVTTMWLSGVAITLKMLTSHIPFTFRNLIHFVEAAQLPIALLTTLSIPVVYVLLRRLFWQPVALLAACIIALDPWLIGYSRVAHVDGLLAHFVFLAALATLVYRATNYNRMWLIVSAVLSGLAVLTKAPAIFLVPYFVLVVATDRQTLLSWTAINTRLKDFVSWTLIIGIMFVTIWPAILFVPNPAGNALVLKRDLSTAAITPHHMVEDYSLEGSHYLFTILTRTTPLTWIGVMMLGVLLIAALIQQRRSPTSLSFMVSWKLLVIDNKYYLFWLVAAYVFFFVLMMTIGAKKGDRYILPIWPALDLLATFGIIATASWIAHLRAWSVNKVMYAATLICSVLLAGTVYSYHPYAIAYSNPFLADNLSQELGWGEGLEQVGAWLNEHAPKAAVASWYPEELGAYTTASVAHINAHEQGQIRFIVLYRNMFGRAPDHYANDFIDEYYKKRNPVHIVRVVDKEFAWVYEKWVFERIVGEMLPTTTVGQEMTVAHEGLTALEILPATYSGKATAGSLLVTLRDMDNQEILERWELPVANLEDDRWKSLPVKTNIAAGQRVYVEISAAGTQPGNAPTIRYTRDFNYRPTNMMLRTLSDVDGTAKPSDLAIRQRFMRGTTLASEEDTKLLPANR